MRQKRTVAFTKNADNLFFHILTRCNLDCSHCYINPEQHGRDTLPVETIQKWLGLFSKRDRRINVIFLGGEPTLHPDLPGAVRAAKAMGYASVTVDTNGYLFHDILARVTPDEVDYFSFSLDGAVAETNDAIRGKGSYEACLNGIRRAVAAGFSVSMIYTVSRRNLHELERMTQRLQDLGIDRFFIQVIGIRGKSAAADPRELQVSREQWQAVIPPAAERIAELGITVTYPKVFLNPEERFECAALVSNNFFVFPNGRVYRCPLCEDFPIHSCAIENDRLVTANRINEADLFPLSIPEGCVLNKIIQPANIRYNPDGTPVYQIACCMLKEELRKI